MSGRLPAWREITAWLAGARAVAALGVLGVVLGGGCLSAAAVRGVAVPPEGNLLETAIFNGSVGLFMLTMAALVPLVRFSGPGYGLWAGTLTVMTLYSYGIETRQAFLGLDPRFSDVASEVEQIAGGVFFVAAIIIMVCFLVLIAKFVPAPSTPMRVAVRYGALASLVAFAVGIIMSALGGRTVAAEGNLLPLHALGFHGLQSVPLIALLLARRGVGDDIARGWVHVAGLAWLGVCISVAAQAGLGLPLLRPGPASLAALGLFAAWLATLAVALRGRTAGA